MVDWESRPLGELVDQTRGISYGIVQPGYANADGVPIVRVTDIRGGRIATAAPLRVAPEIEAKYGRTRLRGGELLLTLVGTVGETAIVPESLRGWNTARAVGVIPVNPDIGARWVQFVLNAPFARERIQTRLNTTVQATLNLGDVTALPIPLPSQEVRRAIIAILGGLDDKIELNRRTNETLEAMARALFKSWFVDFDPVRAKAEGRVPSGMSVEVAKLFPSKREESEFGVLPQGWSATVLGKLTSKIGSGATPRGGGSGYVDSGVSFIRSQNVYDSDFVWSGLARITDADADQLRSVTVHPEDVLLNITGASILRTCVVDPDALPARVNQHVAIVRPREGIPSRYIHLHLLQASTKAYLLGLDAGASRQAVTKSHIESVPILSPPRSILERFSETVMPLYRLQEKARREGHALTAVRDALLPRLLSGELPIRNAEKFVEARL